MRVLISLGLVFGFLYAPAGPLGHGEGAAVQGVFSPPVTVNDNLVGEQYLPKAVVLPSGNLFVAWRDTRNSGTTALRGDIYSSFSVDGGANFTPNVLAARSDCAYYSAPSVAVSPNGTIFIAYEEYVPAYLDKDILLVRSFDGGRTFTSPVKVDDSNRTMVTVQECPSVAVTSAGTVFVAWTDYRAGVTHPRIRGAFSTDGGSTFSASLEISPSTSASREFDATVVANGRRIFVVFLDDFAGSPHPYVCVSTNGGKDFTNPVRLDDTGDPGAVQRDVAAAPLPGGGVVACWEDSRNGFWKIYATTVSVSGNKVTESNIRVDDQYGTADQIAPSISADQFGNLYCAWIDTKDESSNSIRFAYLEVGASAFNSSMEVAKPGLDRFQRWPSVTTLQPGQVFVVWQDDKGGSYEILCSRATFPDLFSLPIARGWNLVTIPTQGYSYNASTLGLMKYDVVVEWNSTEQRYGKTYIVGVSPASCDFVIEDSTAYWIYAGAHEKIKLKGAVPSAQQTKLLSVPQGGGWVLIGLESLNIMRNASDIVSMIDAPQGATSVASYDALTGSYNVYVAGVPKTDYLLVPGKGCWVFVGSSGTLVYTP
ncbi:MAG: sialidase family protein [Thermoplasmata archaeon]